MSRHNNMARFWGINPVPLSERYVKQPDGSYGPDGAPASPEHVERVQRIWSRAYNTCSACGSRTDCSAPSPWRCGAHRSGWSVD